MASSFVLLGLVGKFLRFFLLLFYLSSQNDIRLYSLSEIQIPYLYLRKEAGDNRIVSFGRIITIDWTKVNPEPLYVQRKSWQHDLMVYKQIISVVFEDIDLETCILLFLT